MKAVLLHSRQRLQGVGLDTSLAALNVARFNAKKLLGAPHRATFVHGNFLESCVLLQEHAPFCIAVCNPPYHTKKIAKEKVDDEMLTKEPKMAWCVDGEDPLLYYRQVAEALLKPSHKLGGKKRKREEQSGRKTLLKHNGLLIFECPSWLIEPVQTMLKTNYCCTNVETHLDFTKRPRCISVRCLLYNDVKGSKLERN